jgi:GH15 family glucan-1,4-alpha-glucosidase
MPEVDSNLIGLVIPFHLVEWDDPIFQKTLMRIQKDLITPIGVHRYLKDTYYGGGEWVLLTAWLGWATAQAGDLEKARCMLEWTEAQASPQGELAEQVAHGLFDKASYEFWHKKWGPIASPLLWSHAMYILLVQSIEEMMSRN